MSKNNQQVPTRTNATNSESDMAHTASSGKRKILRIAWVLALCLSFTGWITITLFLDKTTWIDSDGFLHEPLFGLIPISFFFLMMAIVLAVFDIVLKLRKQG